MTRTIVDVKRFWEHHISSLEERKRWMRGHDGVDQPSRQWVIGQVPDGASLLDVGCGPGVEYENFLGAGRSDILERYTGLDISDGMVEACRELFPYGDFQQGSADDLPFEDNSYDVVLLRHVLEHSLGYVHEIAEAVRVARHKVLIIMWRPLTSGPSKLNVRAGDPGDYRGDGSNDFNEWQFWDYLWSFGYPVNYWEFPEGRKPNWAWTITKDAYWQPAIVRIAEPVLSECVFDLDDWWNGNTCWDELYLLKDRFPQLKVNLFAAPGRCDVNLMARVHDTDWAKLCVHGWMHSSNTECRTWTREMAEWVLDSVPFAFSRVFRAPGWQLGEPTRDALMERGWIICDHRDNKGRYEYDRVYWSHDSRMVHGHVQAINHQDPQYRNGLHQLITERGLPWDADTRFRFIEDIV